MEEEMTIDNFVIDTPKELESRLRKSEDVAEILYSLARAIKQTSSLKFAFATKVSEVTRFTLEEAVCRAAERGWYIEQGTELRWHAKPLMNDQKKVIEKNALNALEVIKSIYDDMGYDPDVTLSDIGHELREFFGGNE